MTSLAPPPFIDGGNQLLGQVPARLETGTIARPDGSTIAVLTIRTASTTLTVMLEPGDLATWVSVLEGLQGAAGSGRVQQVTPAQAAALGLRGL